MRKLFAAVIACASLLSLAAGFEFAINPQSAIATLQTKVWFLQLTGVCTALSALGGFWIFERVIRRRARRSN